MAFRSIDEFRQILRETPQAARYLDLHWSTAKTHEDWRRIRIMMTGAERAIHGINDTHAETYLLLANVAGQHAADAMRRAPLARWAA